MKKSIVCIFIGIAVGILIGYFMFFDKVTTNNTISNNVENDEEFNYLAIGNSITWHRICDYWWGEYGMAASEPDKDYYHLVCKALEKEHGEINAECYSFIPWETLSTDRAETLVMLDEHLNKNLDLITIQLGENVIEPSSFDTDFSYLLTYIKEKAPNAELIVVGNFWKNDVVENAKVKSAQDANVKYADITEIMEKNEYRNTIGTEVLGDDLQKHSIQNDAVAAHPNDKAMEYIANKIIELVK